MSERHLQGVGASTGIAIGPVFRYETLALELPDRPAGDLDTEISRFKEARERAKAEIEVLQAAVRERAGDESAEIFEAHTVLLFDPALEDAVKQGVQAGHNVERALDQGARGLAQMLLGMGSELFAQRADDVMDVARRVLRLLLGQEDHSLAALTKPRIIVASELSPSDTALLDPALALGIVLAGGGATSHAAILARTLAIPAVVALGDAALADVQEETTVALNGSTGAVIIDPEPATRQHYANLRDRAAERRSRVRALTHEDARTADGRRVEVQANIGDLESAQQAVAEGAEGVGLLRTEFLYLKAKQPPDEAAQIAIYRDLLAALGGRPVTFRTMDLGGDKPPSFMDFPDEMNPFLGWRGVRVSLDRADLFKTQLRALLQAAADLTNVSIMFPMIEGVETLDAALLLYKEARAELDAAGIVYGRSVQVGIMVETPSAAVLADHLASRVDFFSIGTNDLTQYTLAADRDNQQVASYFRLLHPAVLRLVRQTIEAGHAAGKPVSMCGELAGYPTAIPVLLGLGLDKFSMVPAAVPEAKAILRQLTVEQAQAIAAHALSLPTAAAIDTYVREQVDLGP